MTRRERLRPLLVYTVLGVVLLAGAWSGWQRIGGKDWNYFLGQTQAEVTTLLRCGQFPLWTPWRTGGQPTLAQPETMLLSPVTPLALAFGTLAAFKLLLLPLFVVGCLGMHALARRLGLTGAATRSRSARSRRDSPCWWCRARPARAAPCCSARVRGVASCASASRRSASTSPVST